MPIPTSKIHAEWLSLLEISGPFLSMPVLMGAFPQGLDELEDGQARSLRADYAFWQENAEDPAVHSAWIRLVLESLLGYGGADSATPVLLSGQAISAGWKAEFPEHEETLRPDLMLVDPGNQAPHLLIQVFPPSQSLEKPVRGSRWQASVGTRMMELLHATDVRLGLVTNGEQWMLVNAPHGETTGFTTWYAGLWFDERETLKAFRSLLGVQRFFGVADDQTLESLLAASANDQQEITDQLGLQVRHAVEILIQKIDEADQDSGGELLGKDVPPALLYEAALTVMMRLVFLLSAEERKLLPLDDALYAENYAVSTLRGQLREMAEEDVLERRYDAWSRLLAVFRAVHGGIRHERLNLPPYGGSLFNPDKYPFLEGRRASTAEIAEKNEIPLPVNNRTVLHLLDALQILQVDGEARRLSFRALDVEQIGHVYEGLLDHIAVRASETMVGLKGAKRLEPEISLSELEQAAGRKESFAAWLKDCTGRSDSALKNALASDIFQKDPVFARNLRAACGNDEVLLARVKPFAGLLRTDDFGAPVVILPGSVYVTSGTTRRATGTHYTPRSLTEPVVQHTLEPLVYVGPAEGLPREQWTLRSPAELLDLKICDMAMGSGGFLVQVVRYLAERVVEAMQVEGQKSKVGEADFGLLTFDNLSSDEDRLVYARRLVAERCIYGVDKNPLAVEIAKLSLWLVTLAKDLPFTFLNHALKAGDSLVGASEDDFLRWAHGYKASTMTLFDAQLGDQLETARAKRRELESFVVREAQDALRKDELLAEAEKAMAHIQRGADLLTGARLLGLKAQELEALQSTMLLEYMAGNLDGVIDPEKHYDASRALAAARKERAFHWEFAFPEVFERGGFSAFVGNPPFQYGTLATAELSKEYMDCARSIEPPWHGKSDIVVGFFKRAARFLSKNGKMSLISTSSLLRGETLESGLGHLVKSGFIIYLANGPYIWPGQANVEVVDVSLTKDWNGIYILNGQVVDGIGLDLTPSASDLDAKSLNNPFAIGMLGIKLSPDNREIEFSKYEELISQYPVLQDIYVPTIGGEEIHTLPDIFRVPRAVEPNRFDYLIQTKKSKVQSTPLNTSHPEVYKHSAPAKELQLQLENATFAFACGETSVHLSFISLPTANVIHKHKLIVFPTNSWGTFAVLQSSIHSLWAWRLGLRREARIVYSPKRCALTFPPFDTNTLTITNLEQIGERYHETRREIMLSRSEGLTKLYNRFHDPQEGSEDIVRLRGLHVEMDEAVAGAYGWQDLSLGHDFHETAQGIRYTISESARREVLSRLLKLNHERWEEEQKEMMREGAKEKKAGKTGKPKNRKSEDGQMGLF